ncbi:MULTISPECIES: hypothetical protein [Sphingobacterium]|jgi:hypothetical protein|uniref:Uncharacterized protein n=1 Tax=Sphingobacterium multivorum TaxID=28454 RepID=A0A654DN01_SPHMU|nr:MULTISPECIES: hypothetical protein [Sphingobacterium]HAF35681.1 hypothetical protein [Sphingobacterium sp.]OFV08726.1 hypothetical protein HMPREF3127_25095 [Sphingobacterium sp. HMSC13C05]QQT46284.1 hypothetical protein I6J00_06360 [Sphingobacterium multivorum]QQT61175.1 hypothetical protein I6I97_18445 [Sphingobacterium multivorum]QRQ62899.1 hypothetical protein I6J33_08000 [Sphingobacterium multivorum]
MIHIPVVVWIQSQIEDIDRNEIILAGLFPSLKIDTLCMLFLPSDELLRPEECLGLNGGGYSKIFEF